MTSDPEKLLQEHTVAFPLSLPAHDQKPLTRVAVPRRKGGPACQGATDVVSELMSLLQDWDLMEGGKVRG